MIRILVCFLTIFINNALAFDYTKVRILNDKTSLAIELTIKNDLKIYAPSREQNSKPLVINIKGENLKDYKVIYPKGLIEEVDGIKNYFYKNKVIIPVKIELKDPSLFANLTINLGYVICSDSCLMENKSFNILIGEEIENLMAKEVINQSQLEDTKQNFFLIMFFALVGGMILNLMPCILPILSIKLLGLIKQTNKNAFEIKANILATILGIFLSWFIIGIIIYVMSLFGEIIGFGLHFQSPLFIISLILILLFVSLNLFGLYEFSVPSIILKYLPLNIKDNNLFGSFLTGILLTLLSTPCTAPYLGIATTYAITSKSFAEIIIIFLLIGAGLALPYFVFLIYPNFIKLLPKPGKWVEKFKYIMAILVFLSILWLMNILSVQIGIWPVIVIFMLLLLIKFTFENNQFFLKYKKGKLFTILAIIACIYALPLKIYKDESSFEENNSKLWVKFNEDEIQKYVKENKIVFVDITAQWCLTCKVNKVLNLYRPDFIKLLESGNVIGMRKDITSVSQNDEIYKFMKKHNQMSIPLNIVYGPGAKEGIKLPILFFSNHIQSAINKAGLF